MCILFSRLGSLSHVALFCWFVLKLHIPGCPGTYHPLASDSRMDNLNVNAMSRVTRGADHLGGDDLV